MTDTNEAAMTGRELDALVDRLAECAMEKHSDAWRRPDGGQDLSIGAMLAEEAAAAITVLRARVAELEAELEKVRRDKDCFQRMTRAHWEALCAMRNSINEYVPMPNTDSGPLFSPEDGPIYADIAERVVASLREIREYASALEQELKDRAEQAEAESVHWRREAITEGWKAHGAGELLGAAYEAAALAINAATTGTQPALEDIIRSLTRADAEAAIQAYRRRMDL